MTMDTQVHSEDEESSDEDADWATGPARVKEEEEKLADAEANQPQPDEADWSHDADHGQDEGGDDGTGDEGWNDNAENPELAGRMLYNIIILYKKRSGVGRSVVNKKGRKIAEN